MFWGNTSVKAEELLAVLFSEEKASQTMQTIFFAIRVPRLCAGILCGMALSISGLLLQEALRNPLASPSVIGVNNGAGFFVLLSTVLFGHSLVARTFMAFCGAFASILLIFLISKYAGSAKSILILSGVAVSAFMSAGINFIVTIFPDTVYDKTAFQLGSLQNVQGNLVALGAVILLVATLVVLRWSRGLELFALGDEVAKELGFPIQKYRKWILLLAVLFAAIAVSICGLISFVGLMIPAVVRKMEESDFRKKIMLSAIWGSNLLVYSDVLAKNVMYPYELPVGMLISMIGAPFFIFMIVDRRRNRL